MMATEHDAPRTVGDLARELNRMMTHTDEQAAELSLRVLALEELVFARWPRSILVRRRLRRDLRESTRHMDGGDFFARRINALGTDWIGRDWRPGSQKAGPDPLAGPR